MKRDFGKIYGFDEIKARCDETIGKRERGVPGVMKDRQGTTYIINFKPVGRPESQLAPNAPRYELGLIHMYMSGLPAIKFDQTEISPISVPVEGNQLYYFKIVDTSPKTGARPYSVQGTAKDGSIYENAVITTPHFTLKTPLVRIDQSNQQGQICDPAGPAAMRDLRLVTKDHRVDAAVGSDTTC